MGYRLLVLKVRIKMFTLGVPSAARFLFLARSKEDRISSLQKCFSSFCEAEELSGRISSWSLIPLQSFSAAILCAKDTPESATSASMSLGMNPDVCPAKSFTNLSSILWKVNMHKQEMHCKWRSCLCAWWITMIMNMNSQRFFFKMLSGLRITVNSRNSLSFSDMTKYQLDEYANELFQETPWKY